MENAKISSLHPSGAAIRPPEAAGSHRRVILTPAMAVLLLSVLLIIGSLAIATIELNRTSVETSRRLASATITREAKRVAELTIDYAFWDEAFKHLVLRPDPAWADQNIGSYMHDTFGIAFTAVLDQSGRNILSFHDGQPKSIGMQDMFGKEVLNFILARNRTTAGETPALQANLAPSNEGMYIVGFAPFTPEQMIAAEPAPLPRPILVLARKLDAAALDELGASVGLAGFHITPEQPESSARIALKGLLGTQAGYATWRQVYPGDALLRRLIPAFIGALTAMIILIRMIIQRADKIIRERRLLAGELSQERELSEIRSRFVLMISHELRTPLANIQAAADLMRHYWQRMPDSERKGELAAIQDALSSINSIIEDVVSLDKTGASPLDMAPLDMAEICRDQWRETIAAARTAHQLALQGSGLPALACADLKLMRSVIRNLLGNAVKYSPDASTVHVSFFNDGKYLGMRIADQGCGIPESDASHIFDMFFRGSNVTHIHGIGIGLAIVKQALNQMGGSVSLRASGQSGACFEVRLPGA